MEKTKFSLKSYMKDLIHGINLYKKEQRFIYAVLLCFALSAFTLPVVRDNIITEYLPEDIPIELPQDTEVAADDDENNETDSSQAEDASGQTPSSKPSSSSGSSTAANTGGSGGESADGKTWVPPVYETIHHEAVYETKTVEMCVTEGCGKYFDTPAEFQAHKAAEGG